MRHLAALAVKFVAVAAVLAWVLPLERPMGWHQVAIFALAVTLISYVAGDLGILPAWGQVAALAGDFFLAALTLWGAGQVFPGPALRPGDAVVAAVAVSMVEFFFHRYMQVRVLRTRRTAEQK